MNYQDMINQQIVNGNGDDYTPAKIPVIEKYKTVDIRFRPTDLFNVEMFEILGDCKVLYVKEKKCWFWWNGKYWEEDKTRVGPEQVAQSVIKHTYAMAAGTDDEDQRKAYVEWAMKSESEQRRRAMIAGAERSDVFKIKAEEFDKDNYLFNCQNGVLDLISGELMPHDPDYLMSKISPCNYEPDARSDLWEDTIIKSMKYREELARFLQKYAGLTLTGDVSQKILCFLYGPDGDNGKSTICQTLLHVMGTYGAQIAVSTLMAGVKRNPGAASPDVAQMEGKRLIVTDETEDGSRFNDQKIKSLTGRDSIPARGLYNDEFFFPPKMKIWIYGNNRPAMKGNSPAMRTRMRLIPFDFVFKGKDKDPAAQDKLLEHGEAVLAWMVKGYHMFVEEGMEEPKAVTKATDEYFRDNDKLREYFKKNYVYDPSGDYKLKFSDVFEEITDYMAWNKLSKKKFSEMLRNDLKIKVEKGSGNVSEIRGWRLPNDRDERDEDGYYTHDNDITEDFDDNDVPF